MSQHVGSAGRLPPPLARRSTVRPLSQTLVRMRGASQFCFGMKQNGINLYSVFVYGGHFQLHTHMLVSLSLQPYPLSCSNQGVYPCYIMV